jgi:aspartate aminotransferase-like enzyme
VEKNPAPRAFYFDLRKARAKLDLPDTPYTSAHTLIRALLVSLKRLRKEGIENIWARQARIARAARAGCTAMGLELFAERPADGLTVVNVPNGIDGVEVLSRLEKQHGLKLAGGQDNLKGKIIRLGHMGFVDYFDVLAALAGLEIVLGGMGFKVKPGAGLSAAQSAYTSAAN